MILIVDIPQKRYEARRAATYFCPEASAKPKRPKRCIIVNCYISTYSI